MDSLKNNVPASKQIVQLDQSPRMRTVVADILSASGYAVTAVADADELLQAQAAGGIVGYLLGDETGVEVCCRWRAAGWRGGGITA